MSNSRSPASNAPPSTLGTLTALILTHYTLAADPDTIPTVGDQLAAFTLAEGYQVNLYASEEDTPLANPTAQAFDARGRLYVSTSPLYPHYLPGQTPDDKIIIFEDTDADGKADKHTVFADKLFVPTGFAIDSDGVYVAQQANLWFLQDTDGDDVADKKTIVAHGFGTEDSHHAPSAFTWGPDGAFYFSEGIFHHAQVETPWGPQRLVDAGVHRFTPSSLRTTVVSHRRYYNPWGLAFDRWGQSILSDASDGQHYNFGAVIAAFDYPDKTIPPDPMLRRGRPMAGNLILSSNHFPPDVQGTHLNNQSISLHGIRWDRLTPSGSGWSTTPLPDLLSSTNLTFRPVASDIGPDGALYILDYSNPRTGHMYFKRGDAGHDRTHGRIWRITAKGRPLLTPPPIVGQPVAALLGLLKAYENHTRHFARRELAHHNPAEVSAALVPWIQSLDSSHPEYFQHLLEALWVAAAHESVQYELLAKIIFCKDHRARAAAVRMIRHWLQDGKMEPRQAATLLNITVTDPDQRVRLESVAALGFVDSPAAAELAVQAAAFEMDQNTRAVLQQTLKVLTRRYGSNTATRSFQITTMTAAQLAAEPLDNHIAQAIALHPETSPAAKQQALNFLKISTPSGVAVALFSRAVARRQNLTGITPVLLATDPDELAKNIETLLDLAGSDFPPARLPARAAIAIADANFDRSNFDAATLITSPENLSRLRPSLIAAASTADPAAIRQLGRLPGDPGKTTSILLPLLDIPSTRFAAIEALNDLPDTAPELIIASLSVSAVEKQLLFTPTTLSAKPNQPVRLTFHNPDALPHNLVITLPGTLEEIGAAAAQMASRPGFTGSKANFVPRHPAVLHATPLLLQGETHVLRFFAPDKPGNYLYICTFPGHSNLMHGSLIVR